MRGLIGFLAGVGVSTGAAHLVPQITVTIDWAAFAAGNLPW